MIPLAEFTDEDATRTIVRSIRLLAIMAGCAAAVIWWKMGWRSAGMLLAGAFISGAGLWKWLRLMTVVMDKMDATPNIEPPPAQAAAVADPAQPALADEVEAELPIVKPVAKPTGRVLIGFFLTLGMMLVVLYVSLKVLDGSVYALAAGLAMGVFALTFEALRLVKAWTV